ncbi:MAG: hypothetical protein ACI3ZD_15580 [Prevotella sp.]
MISPVVGIPALLGNPHFKMTDFLKERIGEHEYKAPRMDGNRQTKQEQRPKLAWAMPCEEEEGEANQKIVIDEALIHEFEELEDTQFDY